MLSWEAIDLIIQALGLGLGVFFGGVFLFVCLVGLFVSFQSPLLLSGCRLISIVFTLL